MEDKKKISIVIAYYNRRKIFYNTLKTIEQSKHKDLVEIIVVDDASNDNNKIDDFPDLFDMDIKVIKVEKENKQWMNPCIPFNIGFKEAKGDIIIIQNPECMHFGDIIEYTLNNMKDNLYLSFATYSIDEYNTKEINKIDFNKLTFKNQIGKIITPLRNGHLVKDGTNAWYNHSKWRPLALHFCNAIMKKDLDDLGGFDERFGSGFGFDDNEFIWRIRERKKMNISLIDRPFVIHQFHGVSDYVNNQQSFVKNKNLYELMKTEKKYRVNNDT
jgi:glycosyltransferase involved in cell wall biosynthesis